MDIRERIYNVLQPLLGIDVALQGSFADNEVPAKVITYWVIASPDKKYNGKIAATVPMVQIAFYSQNFSEVLTVPDTISNALLAAGFIRNGNWRDTAYEKSSGHYGKMTDFSFIERGEI
jgi:hypothetical protein